MVSYRAGCHGEASGEVAGTGRGVQRQQQPGPGPADQNGQRVRLGDGLLFAPQGGGAAGTIDQGPGPGVFQVGGDIPNEDRRDQQEPVAGEADCSASEEADLDTAGAPGDARVQALDGRGPAVFADHTHPVHDIALTDRAQLRPVRGKQFVPRLVHRLGDPGDGVR